MPKNKFSFWHEFCVLRLIFALVLGLCASLWAQEKDVPLQSTGSKFGHKPKQMENPPLLQNEGIAPLTPDFWISQNVPKVHRIITGTGAISGLVNQASGDYPIEGVSIIAEQLFCPYDYKFGFSDEDGLYEIDSLPAGDYVVFTENESVFVDVYWDNKPDENSADTVTVESYGIVENIDFSLEVGGEITGTITLLGASSVSVRYGYFLGILPPDMITAAVGPTILRETQPLMLSIDYIPEVTSSKLSTTKVISTHGTITNLTSQVRMPFQ